MANTSSKYPTLRQLILLGIILFIIFCPLSIIFSLIGFYVPLIPGILIPACLVTHVVLRVARKKKRIQWKKSRYFLVIPACFWISTYAFSFTSFCISKQPQLRKTFSMFFSKARFPLADIGGGLAVDNQERLYCISSEYSRLQVFDTEGRFLRGWFVNTRPSDYRLLVDKDDNVIVAKRTRRNQKTFYSYKGELLRKVKISNIDKEFDQDRPTEVKDQYGNIYKLTSPTKVIKRYAQGEETVLLKDTFSLWLLRPGVAFFSFLILIVYVMFTGARFT